MAESARASQKGSPLELRCELIQALDVGMLTASRHEELEVDIEELRRMLRALGAKVRNRNVRESH